MPPKSATRPIRSLSTSGTVVKETNRLTAIAPPLATPAAAFPSQRQLTTSADLMREYVASGGWGWVTEFARTLPQYIDERSRDFGIDLYTKRMRLDAQVESALSTFIMATQAQGLTVSNSIEKGDDGYDTAQAITDFSNKVIDHLDRPISDIFYEMGLGTAQGYKVAEQVYAVEDWGKGAGPQLILKTLACKPQTATAFVVDAYNHVLGMVYTRPGAPIPTLSMLTGPVLTQARDPKSGDPIIIPRSKFWIFSWMPENGDPRGRSILAPAYHPWWVKGQVWKSYLAYLATFAQPSIVGFISANAQPPFLVDQFGNALDPKTPQEAMRDALTMIQNGAVGAFANDEKVQVLQAAGDGKAFIEALNIANREITKAVIRQTLTTDEGEHMARAASEIHQDVFGLLVRFAKRSMVGSFKRDVLKPLIEYNWGTEAARDLLPHVSLGETEHQDFAADATAVANLVRAGFFDESQYRALDTFLDLPERDPVTWNAKVARAEQLVQSAQAQAVSPGAPSADGTPAPSAVAQDMNQLAARMVAKNSAMRIADRVGVVGPA